MTLLQELNRYLDKHDSQQQLDTESLEQLKGLPFYNWSLASAAAKYISTTSSTFKHEASSVVNLTQETSFSQKSSYELKAVSSFNHAIGLPQKNGVAFPLFDYEQMLFNELQNHKHLWIKKATSLGVRVHA